MTIRHTFFYSFVFVCALLSFSFYLQVDGYNPCPLCILQRFTLIGLGIIFFIPSVKEMKKVGVLFFSLLSSIVAFLGLILSGRQVWLQHTPGLHENCSASLQYMLQAFPLKRVITEIFAGSAECTQRGWQFLSLSLAEWSLLCFALLLFISLMQMYRGIRA